MTVPVELAVVLTQNSNKNKMVKFPIYESEALRKTNVRELDLDTRGLNCLVRGRIETVGALLDEGSNLSRMRNMGTKTLNKIMQSLIAYQYSLLDDVEKKSFLQRIIELNN